MYRVTQEIDFCYGHRLINHAGRCRHLHGHNGRAVVVVAGEELDHRGMLIDFTDIKKALRTWIDDTLDHRLILCKDDPAVPILEERGEVLYVVDDNPTAECIARLIFEKGVECGLSVTEVSLWETPQSCATYSKPK
ncbi:MAG: 6-carboxytetrahydropterin synthase [Planctomycetota bacterium]|nr:6-carboxytetrahydropterin synthase [Planctomycetota bacterium]